MINTMYTTHHAYTYTELLRCVQLCDPLDCSSPVASVHRISQASTLEWVAISLWGCSQLRDRTYSSCVSCIANGFFTHWVTGKALYTYEEHVSSTKVILYQSYLKTRLSHCKIRSRNQWPNIGLANIDKERKMIDR